MLSLFTAPTEAKGRHSEKHNANTQNIDCPCKHQGSFDDPSHGSCDTHTRQKGEDTNHHERSSCDRREWLIHVIVTPWWFKSSGPAHRLAAVYAFVTDAGAPTHKENDHSGTADEDPENPLPVHILLRVAQTGNGLQLTKIRGSGACERTEKSWNVKLASRLRALIPISCPIQLPLDGDLKVTGTSAISPIAEPVRGEL